jgi:2-succinyl-6-hydroxy-2,4-cyclohexadiene-1-carboxylate synthase
MKCALLHGFAGDPAVWDDVVAAWQLPEPPVALALPGHGRLAVQPTWHANLAALAGALAGCDVAVGYSLGARVALGLVVEGFVAHGVLIGVNPGIGDLERPSRREFDAAWARMLRDHGMATFISAWEAQPLFATQMRAPAGRRASRREHRLAHDPDELARSLEVMGLSAMPDYRAALPAHRDRIALLAGADDTKYAALARELPAASCDTIPDAGHDPTLEQPVALAHAIARAVASLEARA